MSVEQEKKVDFITIHKPSGELWMTISDHLPWDENEAEHLYILQSKLNSYLSFIESGEIYEKTPEAKGRNIVIDIVLKYSPTANATTFLEKAKAVVKSAGFRLQFRVIHPN